MKILVTGYKGMLGADLMRMLIAENFNEVKGIDIEDLDLTNLNKTIEYIKSYNPQTVINCSGYTNVDGCETEIEAAYKVNAIAPRNLAIASNEVGASLVHISTDYVFDGKSEEPYIEYDNVNPISVYGKSKLAGEYNVTNCTNKFYILRTQWLYGHNGKNFVKTMLRLAKERTEIKVVNDQFGCPTFAKDLCGAIIQLIKTKEYGLYHLTNSGVVSWYEFTKDIFELSCITGVQVKPCTTEEYPTPAKRPAYSPLDNFNYRLCGFKPLRNYKEALKDYLKEENI